MCKMAWIYAYLSGFLLYFTLIKGEIKRPRGVAISKAGFYEPSRDFTCLDGSSSIPFERVNDDYCDCSDGSDEPGTAACPNGSFHCTNAGHKPKYVPSSRVNDAICDCCDGTDEYNGKVTCANYCSELGRQMREEQEKERKLLLEGHEVYKEYSLKGQQAIKEKTERLEQARREKDEWQEKRDELETIKIDAEVPEKEAKDAHKAAWEEEKEKRKVEENKVKCEEAFKDLDSNEDGTVSVSEVQGHPEFDIDSNGAVSVEEAKEYLDDLDQVDYDTFVEKVWPHIKDIYKKPSTGDEEVEKTAEPVHVDAEEADEEREEDEDEDEEGGDHRPDPEDYDIDDDDEDYHEEEDKQKEDEQMPEYDEETKLLIQKADEARAAFDEVQQQINNLDSEIRDLEKLVSLDLGPSQEFYPLRGECYEFSDREYTYKLCPFDRCTQRSKHGGVETNLGHWENWDGEGDLKYLIMKYTKGQNCWNGPDRSVKVKVSCGLENQVMSSSEPNRCEYEYTFSTPAACSRIPDPEKKDLQHDEF